MRRKGSLSVFNVAPVNLKSAESLFLAKQAALDPVFHYDALAQASAYASQFPLHTGLFPLAQKILAKFTALYKTETEYL